MILDYMDILKDLFSFLYSRGSRYSHFQNKSTCICKPWICTHNIFWMGDRWYLHKYLWNDKFNQFQICLVSISVMWTLSIKKRQCKSIKMGNITQKGLPVYYDYYYYHYYLYYYYFIFVLYIYKFIHLFIYLFVIFILFFVGGGGVKLKLVKFI